MKKTSFILFILFFILPFCVFADDFSSNYLWEDDPFMETRGMFRVKDRSFEIGLGHVNAGFSNDFLTVSQIFRRTLVIDLDELSTGFNMNLGIYATPFYFDFNYRNNWGFGFSANAQAFGVLGLSGKMLSLQEADGDVSDASAAMFAEAGLNGFFTLQKFKLKVRPAVFYTLAYVKPDISYTYTNTELGTVMYIGYNLQLYSELPFFYFSSLPDNASFSTSPGVDISLGVEYPLARAIGITNLFPFLDFDVGLDFINIPLAPSKMVNYIELAGHIGTTDPIQITDDLNDFISSFNPDHDVYYREGEKEVMRPFKMLAWADWRLLGNQLLTLTPTVGFAVNPLYVQPVSLEAGLKARLDLANLLILTAGVNFEDRLWKNSLNMAFNCRAFEINIGADMRSPDFAKSWTGGGFGVNVGLKLGW